MQELVKRGRTSNIVTVFLPDSSSTTGAGKTGLSSSSGGLNIAVRRELVSTVTAYTSAGSNVESITTLGTYAAPSSGKCRFKEVDATNQPGVYELQFLDSVLDAGDASRFLSGFIQATGVAPTPFRIPLVAVDHQDATRLGLTALPNAAAEAAGGLFTRGTGAGQINQQSNGLIDSNIERIQNVAQSVTDLKDFADDGYDPSTNKVQGVVLADTVTTYTGNTPQTGDAYAIVNSGTHGNAALKALIDAIDDFVDTEVAAIKAKTDNLPAAPAATGDVTSARDAVLSKLLKYVQLMVRKDAAIGTDNATEKTAINADGGSGGGAFDQATDAQEALRDNMGSLSSSEREAVADAVMVRESSHWEATAPEKSLGTAVMKATHKIAPAGSDLEIFRSDGTTVHATQTLVTNPSLEPIEEIGPATAP